MGVIARLQHCQFGFHGGLELRLVIEELLQALKLRFVSREPRLLLVITSTAEVIADGYSERPRVHTLLITHDLFSCSSNRSLIDVSSCFVVLACDAITFFFLAVWRLRAWAGD
jgi:hypothetical protein